jgi:hypothetical protein
VITSGRIGGGTTSPAPRAHTRLEAQACRRPGCPLLRIHGFVYQVGRGGVEAGGRGGGRELSIPAHQYQLRVAYGEGRGEVDGVVAAKRVALGEIAGERGEGTV